MNKTYKLTDLTEKEVKELRSCEDIKFVLTEHHVIHQSHQTDDYGNEIAPNQYNYNRANMIDRFIIIMFKKIIIFIFMFSFLISYLFLINKTYQLLFEYKENIYIFIITCLIIFLGFFNRNRIIL